MNLASDIKTLFSLVSGAAPMLATALLGPEAGTAISLLCKTFNLQSSDNPADLVGKITADPDHDIKLKQLEDQHGENLVALTNEAYQTAVADRDSAREREEAYLAKTGKHDWMMPFLAVLLFAAIGGAVYCMMEVNAILSSTLSMILGILLREIPAIYSYYFGGTEDAK